MTLESNLDKDVVITTFKATVLGQTRSRFGQTVHDEQSHMVENPFSSCITGMMLHSRAFTSSKTYRDLKLRSAILHGDKQLKVLPKEEIVSTVHGVWNLSSDQVPIL